MVRFFISLTGSETPFRAPIFSPISQRKSSWTPKHPTNGEDRNDPFPVEDIEVVEEEEGSVGHPDEETFEYSSIDGRVEKEFVPEEIEDAIFKYVRRSRKRHHSLHARFIYVTHKLYHHFSSIRKDAILFGRVSDLIKEELKEDNKVRRKL